MLRNSWNRRRFKNNTSGYKGVVPFRGKWRAKCQGKCFGFFSTPEEAYLAYQAASLQIYGEFARSK